MKKLLVLLVCFTAGVWATQADLISINFIENDANQGFAGGANIGPLASDSSNWNNTIDRTSGTLASGNQNDLVSDSSGTPVATIADVVWNASTVWFNSDGVGDDEAKLAVGYLDDGDTGDGIGLTITVTDIPYAQYRVHGLLASDQANEYTTLDFDVNGTWVFGGGTPTTAPAYGNMSTANGATGNNWVLADGVTRGNYWTIETSGSTLTIAGQARNGTERGSLTGLIIEEVMIPEPSTTLLMAMGLGGIGLVSRKRKK